MPGGNELEVTWTFCRQGLCFYWGDGHLILPVDFSPSPTGGQVAVPWPHLDRSSLAQATGNWTGVASLGMCPC
jgi:hypothetical protein